MLILSVVPSAVPSPNDLPSTRGVHTNVIPVDESRTEIRVSLAAPEMLRVFATFVEDVAASAAVETSDTGAVRAFTTRFAHWRRLLASQARGGLSRDAAQGLWGELWLLEHVLYQVWGDAVVDAWTGCDDDAKDFRRGFLAIEVKTTRADAPHSVRINGEHQLEDSGDGVTLVLAILDVESHVAGTGTTLNEVVDAVRQRVSAAKLTILDEKLVEYGYLDSDRDLYETRRYLLSDLRWHKIADGFPRLTSEDLPEGIGHLTYLLSTDAAAPWRIDESSLFRLLGGTG